MTRTRVAIAFVTALETACAGQTPTAPTISPGMTPALPGAVSAAPADISTRAGLETSPYGGGSIPLVEQPGNEPKGGAGMLNDIQTGQPGFDNFELTVNIHGAPPDTDLYFQFSADVVPGSRGDGDCPPFPPPPGNTIGVLHTSAGGSAAAHIKFPVPEGAFFGGFDSGVKSDFAWRVVNLGQTFDLRTPCVVLTGK